ncbi:MAG: phenylalanine--tRNA ligase subunit alpha [Bacteroidota bacterium]|nr:phenylalanine--tRNA ligase subunit alpha [Bacteroidota bacterium]
MENRIKELTKDVETLKATTIEEVEELRIKYLGRKGLLQQLFIDFKKLPPDEKKIYGKSLNIFKQKVNSVIEALKDGFKEKEEYEKYAKLDLSLESPQENVGSRHPISIVKNIIIEHFARIGFTVSEGPEIVDDWHNFTALNFPADHPAKDMQDTFFIRQNPDVLLRTHTSSIQIQEMESKALPIRTISIGRVYRNETISYKSHVQFHQVEGLYVDKGVSFADLKQTLFYYVKQFFGDDYEVRFRPSYFPFTEPSAEMDIRPINSQKWMEILGCGMVDPNVLENCKIDSSKYTGFAFGMGIERMAMLKFGIEDIRTLYENDVRFLEQFTSEV